MKKYSKTIIIGAGPAGLMCANQLKAANHDFLIIEQNNRLGRKLSLTGNGRCNITNNKQINELLAHTTRNYKFLYSTHHNFSTENVIAFFNDNNMSLIEEDDNRMFPSTEKAIDIVTILARDLVDHVLLNAKVTNISYQNGQYKVVVNEVNTYEATNLVIATGGKSMPLTGSTGDGYHFLKAFNHTTTELEPIGVSLKTTNQYNIHETLKGIALPNLNFTYQKHDYCGAMIFTHFGISGPMIFRLSHHLDYTSNAPVYFNFLPGTDASTLTHQEIKIALQNSDLQKRLVNFLIDQELLKEINHFPISITGHTGFEKSFVTRGGIKTTEINPKTFESKLATNLYIIGEIVDVEAYTGGYNITNYFSMGYTAAQAIIVKG